MRRVHRAVAPALTLFVGARLLCILADSRLYDPSSTILANLAGVIPFEISIGLNGRVWVKSGSIPETIALARVLEGLNDGTVKADKASIEKAAKAFMA